MFELDDPLGSKVGMVILGDATGKELGLILVEGALVEVLVGEEEGAKIGEDVGAFVG